MFGPYSHLSRFTSPGPRRRLRVTRLGERAVEDTDFSIDAELPMAMGHVRVVRQSWQGPIERKSETPIHHLELSLLPRSDHARACFPQAWGPHRFEPIGEMFFFPAGEMVHAKSDCRHQNSVVIEFNGAAEWPGAAPEWTSRRLQACLDISSHELRNLMFRMGEEMRAQASPAAG